MIYRVIPLLVASGIAAQADVFSSTQRFFGLGGQNPDYTDVTSEAEVSELGQAPFSPADSDLGVQQIMVERGPREPVIVDLNTSILATSAAPSKSGNDPSSWLFASSLAVAWRPHLVKGWFADIGLGQEVVRYDRTDGLDFENFNSRIGVFKLIPELDDTIVFARFEYQRITTNLRGDYDARRVRLGLQKILWSAPRQQLVTNLSGAYEWSTHPDALERNEYSAQLVYTYSFTDTLSTSVSAGAARYNYNKFGRDDTTYAFAAALIWQMNVNLRASASLAFDKNDSDSGRFNEYEAWTGGPSVGLQLSF